MGGRGGSSGLNKVSPEQKRKMNNLVKRNAKYQKQYGYSAPEFTVNKDGSVSYQYKTEGIYQYVHNSKMQDPSKNDIILRTTIESGKIMKDGLIKKNKPTSTDIIIKKGKR